MVLPSHVEDERENGKSDDFRHKSKSESRVCSCKAMEDYEAKFVVKLENTIVGMLLDMWWRKN